MAQRLLVGFDALDKRSQKILAKHSKSKYLQNKTVMHFVSAPLTFDFASECDPISTTRTNISLLNSTPETKEDEKNLIHKQTSSVLEPLATARRIIKSNQLRPFSVPEDQKVKPTYQKETRTTLEGSTNVKLKSESKSAGYRKSGFRRVKWISKVEGLPKLDILCQKEWKMPIGSALEHRDSSRWYSLAVSNCPPEFTILTGEEVDLCKIYGEVGKLIASQAQRDKQSQVGRYEQSESANQKSRNVCCKQDSSDHNKRECLKITLHPSDTTSEDKADLVSLSLEDEMKKSNVKILSIKNQRTNSPNLRVSETYPIIYNNQFSCRFLTNTWSSSNADPASCDNLSEKRGNSVTYRKANPFIQNRLEYARALLERRQKQSCNAYLKKNKKLTTVSSKQKISIHILSANGTSEILRLTRDKPAPKLNISKSTLETKVPVNKQTFKSVIIPERKHEPTDAGLVLNGVNPTIHLQNEISSDNLKSLKSNSHCFSHCQPVTCSYFHTNSSLDKMVTWEYVSIAKSLSTPRYEKHILPRKEIALSDTKLISSLSHQEESMNVVPWGSLASSTISEITPVTKSPICEDWKESTFKSIPWQKYSRQTDFTEEMPTDAKLDDKELYLEITNGQDPLQNCNTSKPPMISSPLQGPQTQPDDKTTQMQEDIAPEAAAAGTFFIRSLPVINIPTAEGSVSESEEVKTENDFEL
ncbi:uncharacterized protein C1orf141 homolog [Microcaecilia unicolor]|uniref:Uncharacterized protein C1orf141 homolog n=1 Tax=Microcaecilia unicolor TaxID=1415580 RepID=A0A6P7YK08_9AMPH|nr:uncharacterized protein C1orf141 homolog [Microcaecilia unicolor]